jgi:hypothetical protein
MIARGMLLWMLLAASAAQASGVQAQAHVMLRSAVQQQIRPSATNVPSKGKSGDNVSNAGYALLKSTVGLQHSANIPSGSISSSKRLLRSIEQATGTQHRHLDTSTASDVALAAAEADNLSQEATEEARLEQLGLGKAGEDEMDASIVNEVEDKIADDVSSSMAKNLGGGGLSGSDMKELSAEILKDMTSELTGDDASQIKADVDAEEKALEGEEAAAVVTITEGETAGDAEAAVQGVTEKEAAEEVRGCA